MTFSVSYCISSTSNSKDRVIVAAVESCRNKTFHIQTFACCLCIELNLLWCPSAGLKERVSLEGRLPPAEEVVQPKRLLQQIHSEEELLHSRLDTRVRNHTAGAQVSSVCTCGLFLHPELSIPVLLFYIYSCSEQIVTNVSPENGVINV